MSIHFDTVSAFDRQTDGIDKAISRSASACIACWRAIKTGGTVFNSGRYTAGLQRNVNCLRD